MNVVKFCSLHNIIILLNFHIGAILKELFGFLNVQFVYIDTQDLRVRVEIVEHLAQWESCSDTHIEDGLKRIDSVFENVSHSLVRPDADESAEDQIVEEGHNHSEDAGDALSDRFE